MLCIYLSTFLFSIMHTTNIVYTPVDAWWFAWFPSPRDASLAYPLQLPPIDWKWKDRGRGRRWKKKSIQIDELQVRLGPAITALHHICDLWNTPKKKKKQSANIIRFDGHGKKFCTLSPYTVWQGTYDSADSQRKRNSCKENPKCAFPYKFLTWVP